MTIESTGRAVDEHNLSALLFSEMLNRPIDSNDTVPFMNTCHIVDLKGCSESARHLQEHCSPRVFALMTGPQTARPIVERTLPPEFLDYQRRLRGYAVDPVFMEFQHSPNGFPVQQFRGLRGHTLRAYMVTPELLRVARQEELSVADWNEQNIEVLQRFNTKSSLYKFFRQDEKEAELRELQLLKTHTHIVPKALEIGREELARAVCDALSYYQVLYQQLDRRIRALYAQYGISYVPHRAGVMVRPCWGGGNYDSFFVLCPEESPERSYTLHIGRKTFRAESQAELTEIITREVVSRSSALAFLLTRFLNVCASPGMNTLASDGWYYVAPMHGQLFEGTSAIGSCSHMELPPARKKPYYAGYIEAPEREHLLSQARTLASSVARSFCNSGGRGCSGVDLMLNGFFEHAFAEAVRGTELEDEAVDAISLAEVNVRPTQSALQRYIMLSVQKKLAGTQEQPITYRDLIASYEEGEKKSHYVSNDYYQLVDGGWDRLIRQSESLLAGINGTGEGLYIALSPANEKAKTIGIGIMADTQRTLTFYQAQLQAMRVSRRPAAEA